MASVTRRPDPIDGDRELRFHPADPSRARTLSCDQGEHDNHRGFVPALDVFSPELVERMGGPRIDINAARLPLAAPVARTLLPRAYQRSMRRRSPVRAAGTPR